MNVDDSFSYCVDIIECVCYDLNIIESVFYHIDIFEDIFHYMACDMNSICIVSTISTVRHFYCSNNTHVYHCFFDLNKVSTK